MQKTTRSLLREKKKGGKIALQGTLDASVEKGKKKKGGVKQAFREGNR